jgi:hypothetical protein
MPNPLWAPNATIAPGAVIIDSSGNVQQATAAGGITGVNQPTPWGATIGAQTPDNTVVWICAAVIAQPVPPIASIPTSTPPIFVTDSDGLNVNLILADMISEYEAATGRTLQPAQVERLFINFAAYRESLVREAIQSAAQLNLLAFSSYPVIDFLGQYLGVIRLPAQPATTVITFTLANILTVPVTIPAGTPVGTYDGQFTFLTNAAATIAAGANSCSIAATCATSGIGGNGYLAGQVNAQLAPNALIASAVNTAPTNGGSAPETDDHLRTRIQAAPNQFSTAGPAAAYRFFALGVNPSIVEARQNLRARILSLDDKLRIAGASAPSG